MTPEEIKEYLGAMVDIEKECYTHERLLQALKKRMDSLGYDHKIAEPTSKTAKLFDTLIGIVNHHKQVKINQSSYASAKRNYQQSIDADKIRVQKEKKALVYIKNEYDAVLRSDNRLKDARSKLYSLNILFEKYRCFTAVSSLYEYFCANRYTNLGNAYNQLELEARLDRISLQLDVVISKLDQIKENQYTIYSAITDANNKLDSLIQASSRIESNLRNLQIQGEELNSRVAELQVSSDLNLYINAMNHKELEYLNRWC